eukprot:gene29506-39933_t
MFRRCNQLISKPPGSVPTETCRRAAVGQLFSYKADFKKQGNQLHFDLCFHAMQVTRLHFEKYPTVMGAYIPFKVSEVHAFDSFDNLVDWARELVVTPTDDGALPDSDPDHDTECRVEATEPRSVNVLTPAVGRDSVKSFFRGGITQFKGFSYVTIPRDNTNPQVLGCSSIMSRMVLTRLALEDEEYAKVTSSVTEKTGRIKILGPKLVMMRACNKKQNGECCQVAKDGAMVTIKAGQSFEFKLSIQTEGADGPVLCHKATTSGEGTMCAGYKITMNAGPLLAPVTQELEFSKTIEILDKFKNKVTTWMNPITIKAEFLKPGVTDTEWEFPDGVPSATPDGKSSSVTIMVRLTKAATEARGE